MSAFNQTTSDECYAEFERFMSEIGLDVLNCSNTKVINALNKENYVEKIIRKNKKLPVDIVFFRSKDGDYWRFEELDDKIKNFSSSFFSRISRHLENGEDLFELNDFFKKIAHLLSKNEPSNLNEWLDLRRAESNTGESFFEFTAFGQNDSFRKRKLFRKC